MSTEDLPFPAFNYYLDESDPDLVILRCNDGSFVAAFSAVIECGCVKDRALGL